MGEVGQLGRPVKVDRTSYLDAVRKARSTDDLLVSKSMGVDRSTIYRFRQKNNEILKEAEIIIDEITNIRISDKLNKELFLKIPSINEWFDNMEKQRIRKATIDTYINLMMQICKNLKTHPDKITVAQLSELTLKMKGIKDSKIGFSWSTMRKPIRSYLGIIKGISKDILKTLGIDCADTPGTGQYAHQRITQSQRKDFEKTLLKSIDESLTNGWVKYKSEIYLEILYWCKWMYYTATRRLASLELRLDNPNNRYIDNVWIFEIWDKGKKDKPQQWYKMMIDYALDDFKDYLIKRFGSNYKSIDYVFPIIRKIKEQTLNKIIKKALKDAGNTTTIPAHVWRHTFAQDCLSATNYNYELVGTLGGWINTMVLKRHYGAMSEKAKENGLKKAMGLEVIEEKVILRW